MTRSSTERHERAHGSSCRMRSLVDSEPSQRESRTTSTLKLQCRAIRSASSTSSHATVRGSLPVQSGCVGRSKRFGPQGLRGIHHTLQEAANAANSLATVGQTNGPSMCQTVPNSCRQADCVFQHVVTYAFLGAGGIAQACSHTMLTCPSSSAPGEYVHGGLLSSG